MNVVCTTYMAYNIMSANASCAAQTCKLSGAQRRVCFLMPVTVNLSLSLTNSAVV